MERLLSPLGDLERYPAQMRQITLHPVRTNEYRNHWLKWPRSKQVLGTMLLWASRADATQITFEPSRTNPLIYSNQECHSIETELPPPPTDVVESFLPYLRDIAAGCELFGLIRKEAHACPDDALSVIVNVPDIETSKTYRWAMTVGQYSAMFKSNPDLGDGT